MYFILSINELGNISPEEKQETHLFEKMRGDSFLLWADDQNQFLDNLEKCLDQSSLHWEDDYDHNVEIDYYELLELQFDKPREKLMKECFTTKVDYNKFVSAIEKIFDKRNF